MKLMKNLKRGPPVNLPFVTASTKVSTQKNKELVVHGLSGSYLRQNIYGSGTVVFIYSCFSNITWEPCRIRKGANMQQVKAKTTLLASLLRNVDAAKDVTVFVIILRFKGDFFFLN
jgi:hypothetical protein